MRTSNWRFSLAFVATAISFFCSPAARAASITFQGLGDLPGGVFDSFALDVSADGRVVVGGSASATSSTSDPVYEAFRWTNGVMTGLGKLPGASGHSMATSVSDDGSVIAGKSSSASGQQAFRWTSAGMAGLGDLPGGTFRSEAYGVSGDGQVVVGFGTSNSSGGTEAFRWTSAGGIVGLGDLPHGEFNSSAQATSADGSVVVGYGDTSSPPALGGEAFRWTNAGMVGLGDLPGGGFGSLAYGVSADGNVVVGVRDTASTVEAFRWTSGGGMVGLGDLPGGSFFSWASGVSADGNTVVGYGVNTVAQTPFFWTPSLGMVDLSQYLVTHGVDLTGWNLERATAVSANGMTIIGYGTNPSGHEEAWIATIPEPSTLSLAPWLIVVIGIAARCRRWRASSRSRLRRT
jgi:probable HAF family extracellular repeat protein